MATKATRKARALRRRLRRTDRLMSKALDYTAGLGALALLLHYLTGGSLREHAHG